MKTSRLDHRLKRKPNYLTKGRWIYRIENDEGLGPFKKDARTFNKEMAWFSPHRRRELLWRIPFEEFDINQLLVFGFLVKPNVKFGFLNMKQLFTWFNNEELQKLKELGYKVRRVWAEKLLVGEDQCVFYNERKGQGGR